MVKAAARSENLCAAAYFVPLGFQKFGFKFCDLCGDFFL